MACPYFIPVQPWSEPWTGPRRVPLGEPYSGRCSMTTITIAPHDQAAVCNFGYARGRCRHFPSESSIDAVRFSIVAAAQLIWITECEHAPVSYGTEVPLQYEALAKAFVDSHLRRTSSDADKFS